MAYSITITYKGIEMGAANIVAPVCRVFRPDASYIDTVAYQKGFTDAEGEAKYGKSVFATNVDGFGSVEALEPFATTSVPFPVPMTQFKLAVVGEDNKVEFDVDDYKEAFYYEQIGKALADQGFEVTVSKKA